MISSSLVYILMCIIKQEGEIMGISMSRRREIEKYLSKDNLELLLSSGLSANYIATKHFYPEFVSTAGVVINRARVFGIKTHSILESNNLESVRKQRKEHNIKFYGVENASQRQDVKDKKIDSAIKKYGVINVFQSDEIKAKSRKTNLEKYGIEHPGNISCRFERISNFQQEVFDRILKLNLPAELEVYGKFAKFNESLNKKYSPVVDILLTNYPIVVECYGDYFHAHPDTYRDNDIIMKYKGATLAGDIRKFDYVRQLQIESFGYKVIVIWESEYRSNRQIVQERLYEAIENCKNSKN